MNFAFSEWLFELITLCGSIVCVFILELKTDD